MISLVALLACSSLSLGHVAVQGMTTDGSLNHYRISGIVRNNGGNQPSNALQAVDIYKGPIKLDSKSIPMLKAGASFNFTYVTNRSSDAGSGTSRLRFVLVSKNGSICSSQPTTAIVHF